MLKATGWWCASHNAELGWMFMVTHSSSWPRSYRIDNIKMVMCARRTASYCSEAPASVFGVPGLCDELWHGLSPEFNVVKTKENADSYLVRPIKRVKCFERGYIVPDDRIIGTSSWYIFSGRSAFNYRYIWWYCDSVRSFVGFSHNIVGTCFQLNSYYVSFNDWHWCALS